jgi:hypothetical protein
MDDTELQPSRPYRMPLSEVAKVQLYEPVNGMLADPVHREQSQIEGDFDAVNRGRGWRSRPSFSARFFYPLAPTSRSDRASPLATRVVSEDFGWENFDIEYVPIPFGYSEWAADILSNHSSPLKGIEPAQIIYTGPYFVLLGSIIFHHLSLKHYWKGGIQSLTLSYFHWANPQ